MGIICYGKFSKTQRKILKKFVSKTYALSSFARKVEVFQIYQFLEIKLTHKLILTFTIIFTLIPSLGFPIEVVLTFVLLLTYFHTYTFSWTYTQAHIHICMRSLSHNHIHTHILTWTRQSNSK